MTFLGRRSEALELMDQPERVSRAEMAGCLEGIRRVNRFLRGVALANEYTMPFIRRAARQSKGPIRLCDIGTGAADIPVALVKRARREKLNLQIIAVDMDPTLVGEARRACEEFPEIQVVEADARQILRAAAGDGPPRKRHRTLPAPASPFHVVTANLFLHHFRPEEVVAWLALMDEASEVGIVVNDLERHAAAWLGIKAIGPVFSRNRVFLHDAPLSVRRAYTADEWREHARQAGLRLKLHRRWPWRIIMAGSASK